jgi:hypothetical protein
MPLLYVQFVHLIHNRALSIQSCQLEPQNAFHLARQVQKNALSASERIHKIQQVYWLERRLFW